MTEPVLVQEQRRLIRSILETVEQRRQEMAQSAALLRRERAAAESARVQLRSFAARASREAEAMLRDVDQMAGRSSEAGAMPRPARPPEVIGNDLAAEVRARLVACREVISTIRAIRSPSASLAPLAIGMGMAVGVAAVLIGLGLVASAFGAGENLAYALLANAWLLGGAIGLTGIVISAYYTLAKRKGRSIEANRGVLAEIVANVLYLHDRLLEEAQATYERRIAERVARHEEVVEQCERQFRQQLTQLQSTVDRFAARVSVPAMEWSDPMWRSWKPPGSNSDVVYLGELRPGAQDDRLSVPALLPFPHRRPVLFKAGGSGRLLAIRAMQSLLFRILASMAPDSVRVTLIAPRKSSHFFDSFVRPSRQSLPAVSQRVWGGQLEVSQLMAELAAGVAQRPGALSNLAETTVAEGDDDAGGVTRPRVVAILDYPTDFDFASAGMLLRLAERGGSRGVFTMVHVDPTLALPSPSDQEALERIAGLANWTGQGFTWQEELMAPCPIDLDEAPPADVARRIMEAVASEMVELRRLSA